MDLPDLLSPAANWRDQLHEEFRQLSLSLEAEIDRTLAATAHGAFRHVTKGGPHALKVAGCDLGDALQQLEHHVDRTLAAGTEAILQRMALALCADGFDMDVTRIRRPRLREASEPAAWRTVPDVLLVLAGAARPTFVQAARLVAGSARVAREDLAADVDERLARARMLVEAGVEGQIARRGELVGAGRRTGE
jgi:hypothetical protein